MIEKIRKEVEQATMQDLSTRRRQRELVYARAIYFKLCKEKTTLTLQQIADTLGVNHATVLHAIKNVFPEMVTHEPLYKEIYESIRDQEDLAYLKENYNALRKQYDKLLKVKTFDEHTELVDIIREVPKQHIETAKVRVKAMVDMIKTYA
jgi:predicted transcriptional regulator|tara:strand:+ start:1073 stop:1522 length:450 start_codon:yes stop_codon:yes gene_type:complete